MKDPAKAVEERNPASRARSLVVRSFMVWCLLRRRPLVFGRLIGIEGGEWDGYSWKRLKPDGASRWQFC